MVVSVQLIMTPSVREEVVSDVNSRARLALVALSRKPVPSTMILTPAGPIALLGSVAREPKR